MCLTRNRRLVCPASRASRCSSSRVTARSLSLSYVGEQPADLGERHLRSPQHADEPARLDLLGSVATMPGVRINLIRPEQAGLVVDPQRLRAQHGLAGELAAAQGLAGGSGSMPSIVPPAPRAPSSAAVSSHASGRLDQDRC